MRFFELLGLVFENLGRRKARVALTAVGVMIGTAAVVLLVSLGAGLQRSATQELGSIGDLREIQVYPAYGEVFFGPGGGGRGGGGDIPDVTLITDESLGSFAALPGVESVIPRDWVQASMILRVGKLENYPNIIGIGTNDLGDIGLTAQEGELILSRGKVVVGGMVAQVFYDPFLRPGQEMPPPPDLMGRQITLVLFKYTSDGTEVRKTVPLTVGGVLVNTRGEPDYSMYMTLQDVVAINEWVLGRRVNRSRDGYSMAIVRVENVRDVLDITDQISQMGYQATTPQQFIQGANSIFIIIQLVFGGIGAIALLVAAIGIANTMTMAILERTKEIGLMKAIGATNRDVLSIFLGEAGGIGFIGGLAGVMLGWGGAQLLNAVVQSFLAAQAAETGFPPPPLSTYTPVWLPIFATVFATLIGIISGLYPALRAATLIPVNALKYE